MLTGDVIFLGIFFFNTESIAEAPACFSASFSVKMELPTARRSLNQS